MKYVVIAIGLGCCLLGFSCKRKPAETGPTSKPLVAKKTLLRHHFVGAAQFAASADGTQFKKIWALNETTPFRGVLAGRLARAAQDHFSRRSPALGTNSAGLLQPLLDDLLQAESVGEVRETGPSHRELDLAIQLGDERTQVWSTNLWQIASNWNSAPPAGLMGNGFTGWESKKTSGADPFRFFRVGQWVVVSVGQDQLPTNLLNKVVAQGRPIAPAKAYWLDADVDTAQLSSWLPDAPFVRRLAELQIKNFPVAHLAVSAKSEYLITLARLEYAQPVPWKYEPWQVPTNLILNPGNSLINFTAARGLGPLLSDSSALERFGWSPRPSQAYLWGYAPNPLQTYAAFPVRDATNLLGRIGARIEDFVRTVSLTNSVSRVMWDSNRTTIAWLGLPIMVPTVGSAQLPEGEFLYAGLFPPPGTTNEPPPAELLGNLARTNLLYYNWEVTEWRLRQVLGITSLIDLAKTDCTIPQTTPSQLWLAAISTNLGNTVTEISLVSPKELEIVRSAHVGLTGSELVALMRWIEGTNCVEGGVAPVMPSEGKAAHGSAKP
jgi:hypothetical protein